MSFGSKNREKARVGTRNRVHLAEKVARDGSKALTFANIENRTVNAGKKVRNRVTCKLWLIIFRHFKGNISMTMKGRMNVSKPDWS